MYSYMWEFHVRRTLQGAFEKVYGPEGDWVRLFRTNPGYINTLLLRDADDDLRYVTIDTWESQDEYLDFRRQMEAEFQAIDRACKPLLEAERSLGEFERFG